MSKKVTQEELRKFMKEKRENLKSQKIDSPFAKYSSSGQLSCSICNIAIKNSSLWVSHIVGKTHKESLLKIKKSSSDLTSKSGVASGTKRSIDQPQAEKKVKTDVFKVPQEPSAVKSTVASNLLAGYSSSEDESDSETVVESKLESSQNNNLPPNFFDKITNGVPSNSPSAKPPEQKEDNKEKKKSEILPEGFFDDPVQDARARNLVYRDPIEEQWEEFQRSIAEETNVSNSIIEEDMQVSTVEREIYLIDEEIHQWEKKNELEVLVDSVKEKLAEGDVVRNDSESGDEDLDEDDLLDWRSKSLKKS